MKGYVKLPEIENGDEIVKLYKGFIREFQDKIDEFILMEIAMKVAERIPDHEERI